jgi:CheY-like chemotaxis protein
MMDKKRILIVEDEQAMRRMLRLELEAAGYEVSEGENGKIGLQLAKELNPALIISDVLMPEMDGFTFYKELKKSKLTDQIPVLILTARGKMEDSFRVVGVDEFIAKPFVSEDLLRKVQNLTSRSPSMARGQVAKRVLVAGDDVEVIENIVIQLKRVGYHTDLVTSGPQVISKVVLFLPDVLIMEVLMEGIEGPDLIKVLRQMPQGQKIPILIYSFYRIEDLGSEDVRQRALLVDTAEANCMQAGATAYIGRFNENSFMRSVEKYLQTP